MPPCARTQLVVAWTMHSQAGQHVGMWATGLQARHHLQEEGQNEDTELQWAGGTVSHFIVAGAVTRKEGSRSH